jgi:hypothetical protein
MNPFRPRHRKPSTEQHELSLAPPPMRRFGYWIEVGAADAMRRRLVVRCTCGKTATVSLDVLESGESTSCGCAPLTAEQKDRRRAEHEQQDRQRDQRKWKPDRA